MRPWSYYQQWLDVVSRSFALCIPQLDRPFRDHVALAYLLFRVLDTVEDAPFRERATQQRQFGRLRSFLRGTPSRAEIEAFVAAFPAELTDGERSLLGETGALLDEAHGLPASIRDATFGALDRMAVGMAAYTRRAAPMRLVDLEDVSRYCCFVAGIVGEMLTAVWAHVREADGLDIARAYHFGLFLQKVNILKDQKEDEQNGRFFVPDRPALLASVGRDGHGALEYLLEIPTGDPYRVFCGWSLMLGAATIAQLDEMPRSRRSETAELLARTASIADDDNALRQQFAELLPALPDGAANTPLAKPESFEWFRRSLGAPLDDDELRRLGVYQALASAVAR